MSETTGGCREPPPPVSDMVTNNKEDEIDLARFDFKNTYTTTDTGPFFVCIEHKTKNIGRLFPIRVGHYLQQVPEFRRHYRYKSNREDKGQSDIQNIFNRKLAYQPSMYNQK
ncbi:unnamed protein product [Acanthoscelides obtectus]|uniref:Uncharacterized protein n=1 Tax=Acanthoscelides obtectus TaxID=200917 RepID=A0A9P0M512_ACAOB|nr:unnamed protein product [Acanthoscelides obtectus]CAK1681113.1 hypothetical protein AOBTE_LOCUS33023 [Acanthoscelides obtectus]